MKNDSKKIGECICNILNDIREKILYDSDSIEDIKFNAASSTYKKGVEFENILLENSVTTQAIIIKLIRNGEKIMLKLWLDNNNISTRYLTNNGLSLESVKFIMKVISDIKQEKIYLIHGRQREFTFIPGEKRNVILEYYDYINQ